MFSSGTGESFVSVIGIRDFQSYKEGSCRSCGFTLTPVQNTHSICLDLNYFQILLRDKASLSFQNGDNTS